METKQKEFKQHIYCLSASNSPDQIRVSNQWVTNLEGDADVFPICFSLLHENLKTSFNLHEIFFSFQSLLLGVRYQRKPYFLPSSTHFCKIA